MTYAEVVLWQSLKGDKLGVRFRRQVPIEKLIVDFACLAKHLVVEVDGDHHRGPTIGVATPGSDPKGSL